MKHCENCIWFGGYTGTVGGLVQAYYCKDPAPRIRYDHYNSNLICGNYKERKEMNTEEAYKVLQAAWVRLYNVEVGDIVRLVKAAKSYELGCTSSFCNSLDDIGREFIVKAIHSEGGLKVNGWFVPFFCLEFVKKAEPTVEITCKVNGEVTSLKTLSEETILNIRKNG